MILTEVLTIYDTVHSDDNIIGFDLLTQELDMHSVSHVHETCVHLKGSNDGILGRPSEVSDN